MILWTPFKRSLEGPQLANPTWSENGILLAYPFPNVLEALRFSFMFLWQFGYVHGTQWYVVLHDVSICW